jgi:hypothetical protein
MKELKNMEDLVFILGRLLRLCLLHLSSVSQCWELQAQRNR